MPSESKCRNLTYGFEKDYFACRQDDFHANITHNFRVLKHLIQPAHWKIQGKRDTRDFKTGLKTLGDRYASRCNMDSGKCLNSDPVFRLCHFGQAYGINMFKKDRMNDCSLFRRTFGVKGLSYEFNPSLDFWDLYSDKNEYNRMFYDQIHSQDIDGEETTSVNLDSSYFMDFFVYPDSMEKNVYKEMSPHILGHPSHNKNSNQLHETTEGLLVNDFAIATTLANLQWTLLLII